MEPTSKSAAASAFRRRSPDSQDAILLNFFCPTCNKDLFGASEVLEFGELHDAYFEATCPRCHRKCKLRLRDVP